MARPIRPFTARERHLVSQAILERFNEALPIQTVDAELQLDLLKEEFTLCPSLKWESQGAHFVIFKTGDQRFRCQFYYIETQQFGTGKDQYDNLGDCVVTLLQVHAEKEAESQKIRSAFNAVDFDKANDGEEYFGPLIV